MNENIFLDLITFIREQIREFDAPMTRETLIEDGLIIHKEKLLGMLKIKTEFLESAT
jgi:hypothetical protein